MRALVIGGSLGGEQGPQQFNIIESSEHANKSFLFVEKPGPA